MKSSLEISPDQFRNLVQMSMDCIDQFLRDNSTAPTNDVEGALDLCRDLREDVPESPSSFEDLLELLFGLAVPKSYNTTSPGYLAYVPGGGLAHTALADLISNITNRFTGIWIPAPLLVQLEINVLSWLCELVGYQAGSGGILTTGGSLATLSAIVAARHRVPNSEWGKCVIYASDQTHHAISKSALVAGIPASRVRLIATDELSRISLEHLAQAVQDDQTNGLHPIMVVGNAGTTNSGAIDDLPGLAQFCQTHSFWFHVDAAYGGFFVLTERGRDKLDGIAEADSIVLDPHKGMFLPYGTGALLVKNRESLRIAHDVHAEYLPPRHTEEGIVDFSQHSAELSRDYRGLRLWLPMKLLGVSAFRQALDEKLDLAQILADQLRELPGIRLLAQPELSLFAFCCDDPTAARNELNELTVRLMDLINSRQRVFLSGTTIGSRFVIRVCILSFRTHREQIDHCVEDIGWALNKLASLKC